MAQINATQKAAVVAAHRVLDALSMVAPGMPDTAAAREARQVRSDLETQFPDAFTKDTPPIVVAKK